MYFNHNGMRLDTQNPVKSREPVACTKSLQGGKTEACGPECRWTDTRTPQTDEIPLQWENSLQKRWRMSQRDTHFSLWPHTHIYTEHSLAMPLYPAFQMALLGLWNGEVEEKEYFRENFFLTNVLISTDKSGACHPRPKSSYPQVDSSSWCWPGQDVSMNIGNRWDLPSPCCPNILGLCQTYEQSLYQELSAIRFYWLLPPGKCLYLCLTYRIPHSPPHLFFFKG